MMFSFDSNEVCQWCTEPCRVEHESTAEEPGYLDCPYYDTPEQCVSIMEEWFQAIDAREFDDEDGIIVRHDDSIYSIDYRTGVTKVWDDPSLAYKELIV